MLLAYVKIALEEEILASAVPDEPWTPASVLEYFPTPLRERRADRMAGHPLRREIITTVLVNDVVNRGGISFVYRAMRRPARARRRDARLRRGPRGLRPAPGCGRAPRRWTTRCPPRRRRLCT